MRYRGADLDDGTVQLHLKINILQVFEDRAVFFFVVFDLLVGLIEFADRFLQGFGPFGDLFFQVLLVGAVFDDQPGAFHSLTDGVQ